MNHSECNHKTPLPEMDGRLNIVGIHCGELKFHAKDTGWIIAPGHYVMILPHDEYGNPTGVRTIIPFTELVMLKEVDNSTEALDAYDAWYSKEHGMSREEENDIRTHGYITKALMDMGINPDNLGGF